LVASLANGDTLGLFRATCSRTSIRSVISRCLGRIVGALDVVRTYSGGPLRISDEDIRIIRSIEIGLNTPRPVKIVHDFKRGEKVSFIDDLIGRWPPGVIEKLAPDGRIGVEVDLMGRKVPITVLPHQIERT